MTRAEISRLKRTLIAFDEKLDKHMSNQDHESKAYWWAVDTQAAVSNLIGRLSPPSSSRQR